MNRIAQTLRLFSPIDKVERLAVLDTIDLGSFINDAHIITRINVPREARGHGYGRQLLKQACDMADTLGVDLLLEPMPYADCPLSLEELTAWYERNGFVMFGGVMRRTAKK